MPTRLPPVLLLVLLSAVALLPARGWGQGAHGHGHPMMAPAQAVSPYAGQQQRALKALAPEEERSLLRGEGMGMAKAGELNHYPGPRHVLELAAELGLDAQQRASVEAVLAAMSQRAQALGGAIVQQERELDAAFAGRAIDAQSLARLTGRIAQLQGELRAVHLQAHLEMRRLLTDGQVAAYDRLRGYQTQ